MSFLDGFTFVKTVEVLLAINGKSKTEFYEQSGVSDATMSQYRSEYAKKPRASTVKRAADFFKMTPEEFENYLENKKSPVQAESPDGELENLIQRLLRLPPEQRKLVSDLVDNLAK